MGTHVTASDTHVTVPKREQDVTSTDTVVFDRIMVESQEGSVGKNWFVSEIRTLSTTECRFTVV